jgi:hypothetical protein
LTIATTILAPCDSRYPSSPHPRKRVDNLHRLFNRSRAVMLAGINSDSTRNTGID